MSKLGFIAIADYDLFRSLQVGHIYNLYKALLTVVSFEIAIKKAT